MNKQSILEARFSYFEAPLSNVKPSKDLTVEGIIQVLRKGGLDFQTRALRAAAGDKEAYASLKKTRFPYVTFSGTFSQRSGSSLIKHSGFICIDLDHLGGNLDLVRRKVEQDLDHVVLSFVSPGGDGLKVVYPIDLSVAAHEKWVRQYQEHLRKLTGIDSLQVDNQCKDVARACLIPHDRLAFLNPMLDCKAQQDVRPIEYSEPPEDPQTSYESDESWRSISSEEGPAELPPVVGGLDFRRVNSDDNFLRLCQITARHVGKYGRPRNPWIQKLASRCNLFGMDQLFCEQSVVKYFRNLPASHDPSDPLSITEHFLSPIRSTYKNYRNAHGTWTKLETNSFETPTLPIAVYDNLPELLSEGCNFFEDANERDLFFLGLLTAISACMPNVSGRYAKYMLQANLFLMIVAPAASGKGNLTWSFKAVEDIIRRSDEEFDEEMLRYQDALEQPEGPKPKKPVYKSLMIPGNSSAPAVMQALSENGGRGLIFETEADTIANTMQNDWGNYSDIVRRAFHHERLSFRRRHENQHYTIKHSYLSIVLSGTPDQVRSLLQSTENGFFSRILFYDFKSKLEFRDPFDNDNDTVFLNYMESRLPQRIKALYERCNSLERVEFTITQDQRCQFNASFKQWLLESEYMIGTDSVPTIIRLAVITFRIAMILTAVRSLDTLTDKEVLICKDEDFASSLQIVDCLRMHAFKLIAGMKRANRGFKGFSNDQQRTYYLYLPNQFSRREADERAKAIRLNPKTAEKYLEDYRNSGLLEHVKHGEYKKTNVGLQIAA